MQVFGKLTSSFKSLPRSKPSVWQNKTRKDVNDLNYYPKELKDIQYIKKGTKSLQKDNNNIKTTTNNKIKKAMDKYNVIPYSPNLNTTTSSRISFSQYNINHTQKKSSILLEKINPQKCQTQSNLKKQIYNKTQQNGGFSKTTSQGLFPKSKSNFIVENSNINKLGLSSFQFGQVTIQGKMHSKYGYNVDLSKCKTNKYNNVNTIFYNKDEIIDFHQMEKKRYVETLAKYRNFRSYSSRNLFKYNNVGHGGSLDKLYNVTNNQIDKIKKRASLNIDFIKISPRPNLPLKLGTQLQYSNSYKQMAISNSHKPIYETQKLKRQLNISRQVISNSRGCYR